jgi:hypothetical protein
VRLHVCVCVCVLVYASVCVPFCCVRLRVSSCVSSGAWLPQDFEQCKSKLIERGEQFAETALVSRQKILRFGDRFIHDGTVRKHAIGYRSHDQSTISIRAQFGMEVPVSCICLF